MIEAIQDGLLQEGELPRGLWVWFCTDATCEQVRRLFEMRTGILVATNRVRKARDGSVIMSLPNEDVRELVAWSLSEDTLLGQRVVIKGVE